MTKSTKIIALVIEGLIMSIVGLFFFYLPMNSILVVVVYLVVALVIVLTIKTNKKF